MRTLRILLSLPVLLVLALAATSAEAQKRVALVVGNSAYAKATALANPANDAGDIAIALTEVGFEVIVGLDLDKAGFDRKVREFARALEGADAGLFYYAGHGLQVGGQNFLLPVDTALQSERDLDFETVRLDFILRQMELGREGKTNIVILDACRDNPLARNLARSMGTRSASIGTGLAQVQTGVGTFIAYSTQPGNIALDGAGRNSPFTGALKLRVKEAGRHLSAIMIDVRKDVLASTSGRQVPWDHSALTGDFYFVLASAPQSIQRPVPGAGASEAELLKERLRRLEEELQKRNAAAETASTAVLAQLRQRHRQLDDENRRDRDRMFQIQIEQSKENDSGRRLALTQELFRIQGAINRRGQDQKELLSQIERVEKEMGGKTGAQK